MILLAWCLFAAGALLVLWIAVRTHQLDKVSVEELPGMLQPMDLEAFLNLVDPAEDEFLAHELPRNVLARIRKERLRAVLEYLGRARHNAAILLRLGEAAQRSSDGELAMHGSQLVSVALRFRTNAMLLTLKTYAALLAGGSPVNIGAFRERYGELKSACQAVLPAGAASQRAPVVASF
jgi:hypothetical protein